ncbi:MAG: DUF4136 domain-containing protein, partial [Bacteroidota bacterium]
KSLKYVLVLLCFGCASKVVYDYDIKTNFSNYKTYHYFDDVGDSLSQLDIKRFTRSIDTYIDSIGIQNAENPSFYINVIAERLELQQKDTGLGIGIGGGNFGGSVSTSVNFGAQKVKEKITIDFVDANTNKIFWQGFVTKNVKERMKTKDRVWYIQKVVEELLKANKKFVAKAKKWKEYQELPFTIIGSDQQQVAKFTIQHAVGNDRPLWKQEQIAKGVKNKNNAHAIAIAQPGKYRISCRRWPEEYPGAVTGTPTRHPKHNFKYESISPEKVRVELFDQEYEKTILQAAEEVAFELELPKGKTMLKADFIEQGERYGVYYIYAEKMDEYDR